jgi:hypothetical protein
VFRTDPLTTSSWSLTFRAQYVTSKRRTPKTSPLRSHPCAGLCWRPYRRDKTAEHKAHIAAASLQIPYLLRISDKHNLIFPDAVQILLSDTHNKVHRQRQFCLGLRPPVIHTKDIKNRTDNSYFTTQVTVVLFNSEPHRENV